MDAQQFLAEFGHIANAPRGITQLRQMIYQLAVTGALIPRVENVDGAGQLLSSIGKERRRLIQAKKYKRLLELESEPVHAPQGIVLPETWQWSRLLDIGEINPRNEAPDDQLAAFVPMSGVPQLYKAPIVAETKRWSDIKKGYTHFANGDVVLAKITPCFENGKAAVVERLPGDAGIGAGTTELQVFRAIHPGVLPSYVYLFLRSPLFTIEGERNMTGTAGQKRVPTDYFATRAFPLPPTEEQSKIIAKVDELMALCDQLEAQQQDRRKLQNALRQSILQALASAQSPLELQDSWQRLQTNFERLFSEQGDVRLFRDVLFDLALRGMLLPESKLATRDDSSGMELGALPMGWEWKTLADLSEYITSGSRGWKAYMSSAGDSFIRSQDIRQDALIFDSPAFVNLPERVEGKRTLVRPGDVLLTITGGNVGRCAVIPELPNKAYVSQHVALIRLNEPSLAEFIHFWMVNAFGGRAFLARYIYGDKPGLNLTQVGSVPIPVPPEPVLSEILASLRRHQELCDELAQQLDAKCDLAVRLSIAAVAALTGVTLEQDQDISVKAPQTELVAPLCLGVPPDAKAQAPLATILVRHNGELSARDLWQRFGGEIDAFYAQLKTEVAHGWIAEPKVAEVREKPTETVGG
ncbi:MULTISPECIES: restriction endonuclease subunit S [unclassified Paraburkholderia]|uniref:restriction endonuclease subunit S n=1 Tax=unclassified Paraburkholderia TaxID=2615204 RepID=UPI002AB08A7B|nr:MULTISPECIES: restriction endonuclease subunit S [unclassified Paraburkholderia]